MWAFSPTCTRPSRWRPERVRSPGGIGSEEVSDALKQRNTSAGACHAVPASRPWNLRTRFLPSPGPGHVGLLFSKIPCSAFPDLLDGGMPRLAFPILGSTLRIRARNVPSGDGHPNTVPPLSAQLHSLRGARALRRQGRATQGPLTRQEAHVPGEHRSSEQLGRAGPSAKNEHASGSSCNPCMTTSGGDLPFRRGLDVLAAPARHEPGSVHDLGPHIRDQRPFRGGEQVPEGRRPGEDEPVRPRPGCPICVGPRQIEIQPVIGTECQRRDEDLEAHSACAG